jgi:hypothetical protein
MTDLGKHKPDCNCPPCVQVRGVREREAAAARLEQTRRDVAWLAVMGQGGPDAVIALARQHGEPERAARLLAAGGFDAAGIMDRYRAEAPHAAQSSSNESMFVHDPEHSPEAMRLLNGFWQTVTEQGEERREWVPGSIQAFNKKVAELREAREQEKAGRTVDRRVLHPATAMVVRHPDGSAVIKEGGPVYEDERAQPLMGQRSAVSHEWTDFRDYGGSVA